jgi:beta-D-xylosidase 4
MTSWETVTASVENTGKSASDYVGMLFLSSTDAGPAPRPIKSLVSYARLHGIPVAGSQVLQLPLTLGSIARANEAGDLVIYPGDYKIALDVDETLTFNFTLRGQEAVIDSLPAPRDNYNYTVPVTVQPPSWEAH